MLDRTVPASQAVGVVLVIPMIISWIRLGEWVDIDLEWRQIFHEGIPWRPLVRALLAFSPIFAFLIWKFSYLGLAFDYIESNFFWTWFSIIGLCILRLE